MRQFNASVVIFILLISTINFPIFFSSIALSQEQQQTTQTTTEQTQTTTAETTQTTTQPTPTTTTPTTTTTETIQPAPTPAPEPTPTPEKPPIVISPQPPQPICPVPPSPIACGENQGLFTNYDDKGCVTGYECKEMAKPEVTPTPEITPIRLCPEIPPPTIKCPTNEQLNKIIDDKGCIVGFNCVAIAPPTVEKPPEAICPAVVIEKPPCDGSIVPVFDRGCLISYSCVPKGCRQETDPNGFTRVVCQQERRCPADEQQAELKKQCYEQDGNPVPFQDPSGCTFYDCRFDKREVNPNPISGYQTCPSEEENNQMVSKCKESGSSPGVVFEGGCKIVRCTQPAGPACPPMLESEVAKQKSECNAQGLILERFVDENGCGYHKCVESKQFCQRDVPSEAYKNCDGKGGEMIVKTNKQGCVEFSQCIMPGDKSNAYVAPVEEVPDTVVLLSLALKLEQLKIELQKLGTESKEIAKFYASTGSIDEERYNRVSSMFDASAQRINEIKVKIRDNAETMTTDSLVEIKSDIKYIKEVTLKDILYIMLSNSDDIRETLESSRKIAEGKIISVGELKGSITNCGTDGACFDKAIRSCKPITFQPEGRSGPLITIMGLKDKNCVLHVTMQSTDTIPPGFTQDSFYMDCAIANYALGIRGPDDILPYCEGPMAKFAKQFGGGEVTGGEKFPPPEGGPGGCTTEKDCVIYCIDNYDECKQWVKEHPAYGPMPSKEELRRAASGKGIEGGKVQTGVQGFGGPGGCKNDKECSEYCSKNPEECLKWCRNNPGMCPTEAEQGLKQVMKGKSVCGNNICEPDFGETFKNCYDDCIEGKCGNGVCEENFGESYDVCPSDCMRKVKSKNQFNDEKDFLQNMRNIGSVTTIDFETLPDGTALFDRMRLSGEEYSSMGVTFYTPTQKYLQAFGPEGPFEPIGAFSLSPGPGPFQEGEGATHDNLHIIFSTPVKAVGFYMLDLGEPDNRESVTFYDEKGRIIDVMSLNKFVGFISDSVGIQKVVIVENANDADDVAFDNIHFVRMGEVRESGGCECTWASGTQEHPMGCPVLCSDYSYDQAACEAQARNGCTWFGGRVETIEREAYAVQACVGCLNNGICDVGECSECGDCLKVGTGISKPKGAVQQVQTVQQQ